MTQRLLLSTKSLLLLKPDQHHIRNPPNHFDSNPFHFSTSSLPLFTYKALTFSISVNGRRVNSFPTRHSQSSNDQSFVQILILFVFTSILLVLRLFSTVLLPDFPRRWRNLLTFSEEAEARTCIYPSHVWEAIVAYEDRRFFKHFGVDPVGIARAAVSFSTLGGGSTITQQSSYIQILRHQTFCLWIVLVLSCPLGMELLKLLFQIPVLSSPTSTCASFTWHQTRSSGLLIVMLLSLILLTEMGNLVLLDQFKNTLWESFQHPTDTIVIGQLLAAGTLLYSSVSNNDFSTGDYRLAISASDAILQWHGQTYWKLSMDTRAFTNSNFIVEYLAVNRTGLFLFGHNGSAVVIQVILSPSDFRIAKLGSSGQFTVSSFSDSEWKQEFVGPIDGCRIPFICGRLGLCTAGAASASPVCSCPSSFHGSSLNTSGCAPSDGSYSLPLGCSSTNQGIELNSSAVSYLRLGYGMDYFANLFSQPIFGVNLSVCQDLCTKNCSCLGIFYENSSSSCYVLENELGSIIFSNTGQNDLFSYIKAFAKPTSPNNKGNGYSDKGQKFPVVALVLLPFTGFFLLVALGFFLRRRRRLSKKREIQLGHHRSFSSGDLDAFYIPGLPKRFDYEELELATDNFNTQIGSGGFGSVYKGTLPDKTIVAVKKITNLGVQGKKEFCTEIAIIGNIHHANLVKLKGFCAQGRLRLLVYEYMNRGSLDRTLFGTGPVLEWQERVDIALGTARGLAYLHSGCEQKIIHCDIKPENILLHDQFQAKISDFGLSKLLSPEQSSLFTTMRGTRGYLAPEWLTNAAISEKTDVYSFGMVLLELVSGRKNCSIRSQSHSLNDSNSGGAVSSSSSSSGLIYFPLFALEMHEQGRYLELVDQRLERRVTSDEVEKLVRVALLCVHEEPALRPNMVSVVGMLEGGMPLGQPRLESLDFLRFYGRRFTEASMIEEATEQNDTELHPPANASSASSMSDSRYYFSYVSSQQISGPR